LADVLDKKLPKPELINRTAGSFGKVVYVADLLNLRFSGSWSQQFKKLAIG